MVERWASPLQVGRGRIAAALSCASPQFCGLLQGPWDEPVGLREGGGC